MQYPSDLAIRFARPGDCPTILRFIHELAEYERLAGECIADEPRLRASLFGERPAAEVVLAELAGEPVGFALFFHNYSTFLAQAGLYIEDIYVRPSERGRGIGAALMSALARIAVQRGCGRFEWSVLDWNAPALRFYASLGAVPMDQWTVQRMLGAPVAALAERWPHPVQPA